MVEEVIRLSEKLGLRVKQIEATVQLLDEGATIPFIARYRKEATGGLDEVQIAQIRDEVERLRELEKRRETILKSIEEQGKLTDELKAAILAADTMSVLEDLYLPYRPKRRTKATMAKEKGLEPLARQLFEQAENLIPETAAQAFIDAEKGVNTTEEALEGARHIIAEWINETQEVRARLRDLFEETALIKSKVIKGKEEEGQKFRDYFEWEEPLKSIPSHRLLAIRRGESEMVLSVSIEPDEETAIAQIERLVLQNQSPAAEQVRLAIADAYKRLLRPSLETEMRLASKQRADEEAIKVFADNLRELLLASPFGEKRVLAIDPGFRTGCKVVVLDEHGQLLHDDVIYPNEPQNQKEAAGQLLRRLCEQYKVEAIAIGNGTASRETEQFVRQLQIPGVLVVMVNESGASVYSASKVAREEFPDKDVTVRGAVSIGRRLQDPLAELVKIDPKSIGVGQYQHDVDQKALKKSLDDVVISCVNAVGVELNTASKQLLSYVSGLSERLADNIIAYRTANGGFRNREELKRVPGIGPKTFELAAGFLRIRNGEHPLDASAVHPESYHIVEQMAKDLGCSIEDLLRDAKLRAQIQIERYVSDKIGLPTLQDIMNELAKPGRDPRQEFEVFQFDERVHSIEDLRPGMRLPGIVTNVTKFGAFVDIGVHQDGLVHISELSHEYVSDPAQVVKVHQKVMVTVLEVDIQRRRIALSMKGDAPASKKKAKSKTKAHAKQEEDMAAKLAALRAKFGQ
ncbi:Tex family protein [Thermonema rossianum]|uniref:Tex family protein n=1 Tax=Thermonema rossianum TaxID=55505 RepID=UPI00056F1081|nr:Tex family protein [Thermonema rossianum]